LLFGPAPDATRETVFDSFMQALGVSLRVITDRARGASAQRRLLDTGDAVPRQTVVGAIPFVVGPDGKAYVALAQATNSYSGRNIPLLPKGYADTPGSDGAIHGRGNAIKEAWEETGLLLRDVSNAAIPARGHRYYPMLISGGHPALMGWESQHVQLVELTQAVSNSVAGLDSNTSNSVRASVEALQQFARAFAAGQISTTAPAAPGGWRAPSGLRR
jgi:8-oxo-dGTP pyrophosphatase MutT (NUDIX family)